MGDNRRRRSWRQLACFALAIVFSAGLSTAPAIAESDSGERECQDVTVPVALSAGTPKNQHIFGRLCVPAGQSPDTIQVLVHGITYTHEYWHFPDPSEGTARYDYSMAANDAGYATLAIDRIGSGRSSHPLSTLIDIDTNAYTVH
ncbi:hypothetical protein SAMN06265360_105268 [Haloechinothrix alba]|uniref:Alpha/beta hydrolase family protein n=1 Tax=Haloechinothrix alba TaxID=664784 RepID=A0A238WAP0_9PSEU|nr:hypothetical protein [Haloechinothrix alba]SNR43273.1 hypothetical protein SAMN06265360_105268 [Haloechinothrix alba]